MMNNHEVPGRGAAGSDQLEHMSEELQFLAKRLRWAQESQALAVRILALLNKQESSCEAIREILKMVKDFTGFEAAGIRLRDGDDYPYIETDGFPGHFVDMESSLCGRDATGAIIRDEKGQAVLECMCGNVIRGRTNPSFPFFTEGGSFWTNSTTELLATTSEADRQSSTRNRCNGENYESVALIPLKSDRETIGLLQLNDSRKNCFTLEMITFFEGIGTSLGIVLARAGIEEALRQANEELENRVKLRTAELARANKQLIRENEDKALVEEKLRRSEAMFSDLYENAPCAYFSVDTHGIIGLCNKRAEELLGYPRESLIGKSVFELYADGPNGKEKRRKLSRRFQEGATLADEEFQMLTADGSILWVSLTTNSLRDAGGAIIGWRSMVLNITERKRVEGALRESEQRFRAIFDNDHVVMLIVNPATGQIEEASPGACAFYGWSKEELKKKNIGDINRLTREQVAEKLAMAKLRQTRYFDFQHTLANGAIRDVEVCTGPIVIGARTFLFSVITDVTDRKRAEEDLRESEERFRKVFEQGPLGIAMVGLDYRWIAANSALCRMVGYTEEELTKLTFIDITYPEDIKSDVDYAEKLMRGEITSYWLEKRYLKKNGDVVWVHLTTSLVLDNEGKPLYFLSMMEDITQRKEAEEALRQSEAMLRNILATSPVGLVGLAENRTIRWVNDACLKMFGFGNEDEALGRDSRIAYASDEEYERVGSSLFKSLETGEIVSVDTKFIRKDGSIFDGNIRMKATGGPDLAVAAISDISERKRAEDALRQSGQRLELVLQGADLGLYDWDIPSGRAVANRRSAEIVGYELDELDQNFNFWENLLHPEDRPDAVEKVFNHLAGFTDYYEDEYRVRAKSGEWKWILSRGRVMERDESGAPLRMTGTYLDITDRKKSELLRKEIHDLNEKIIYSSPLGIEVFREDGPSVLANEALANAVGCTREQLLTQNFRNIPSWRTSGLLSDAEEALATGIDKRREIQVTTTFGKEVQAETYFARFKSGGEYHLLMLFHDITERRQAEEALRFEREQLLSIFESISEVALVIDPTSYEILYANKFTENLYGKRLIGELCHEGLNGFAGPCRTCLNETVTSSPGGRHQWEYRNPILQRDYLATDRIIKWPDGRDVKFQLAIDITDRKRAEREKERLWSQLLQAQKMEAIGTLAGGIAHDFNNLLTVVLGYSELLMLGVDRRDSSYGDLQKINQSARNGAELVKRLLAFSRKTELDARPLNLNDQIEQVKSLLVRTIPKMIEIGLVLSDEISTVNAGAIQMEQVLMNLAVNAADAMPDGGKLIIKTEGVDLDEEYCRLRLGAEPGSYVLLSVSDSGHGMDAETLKHIFEPFYTTKETGRGTGLGLAMVYGIVKQHGGHITCYSEPGLGTTFKIYLPISGARVESPEAKAVTLPLRGSETILLVDDEEHIRSLGKRILERSGYRVLTAVNGKEALDIYAESKSEIDLVILDLIMPEMGGNECLKRLLKINGKVKVLISSGYAAAGESKGSKEMGAKGFVGKPYNMTQMLEAVRQTLDS
jgi:two-component system, cell cycle sensor histidine kinase and response regulator CckA